MTQRLPSYCIEYFHAKANCRAKLNAQLLKLAKLSRQEPGCLQYDVLVDQTNPDLFILVLKYTSAETMQRHEEQAYVKRFAEHDMGELCCEVKWHDAVPA